MYANDRPSRRRFLKASAVATLAFVGRQRSTIAADADLIVRSPEPYNAEPPLGALASERITPVKHFYVRNHGPMPVADAASHKLRIEGLVHRPGDLSLAEVQGRFRQQTAEATLTCAGNRRREMSAIQPVGGVQWDAGAIGNGRWTGATLADVLRWAEIKDGAKHVWFEGLDAIKEKDGSVAPFGGSIPLDKALAGDLSVLVVHAMNGEPLRREHGFPLRTIVPGFVGARSVKWLTKITLSDRPSPNHYVAEAYKLIQTEAKDEVSAASPIYGFPVNAAICSPSAGDKLQAGRATVQGYALASGDLAGTIARVEVSRDGGRNWASGKLIGEARPFAWQPWAAELDLPAGKHDLVVRATDSRGNTMPERAEWNLKGYLYNGWHHVSVEAT